MKVGMLGLSNPVSVERYQNEKAWLEKNGFMVEVSPILSQSSTGKERATIFNDWVKNDFDYIFDVSGGDLANETLEYLDYKAFQKSKVLFFGYSDLTCVINALFTKSKRSSVLYQICSHTNKEELLNFLTNKSEGLLENKGRTMVGGNIRCFLKLAGTSYFPNLKNKILFLESNSGKENRIRAYFAQLQTMGVFDDISCLVLGQYTEMEEIGQYDKVVSIAQSYFPKVEIMKSVGHSNDSKGLRIG